MKRIIFALFLAVLAGLFVWLLVKRPELSLSPEARQNVRTIIPSADNKPAKTGTIDEEKTAYDESRAQPMITIGPDETFLQGITLDINKDGTQDQICAIKMVSEPSIFLVPAMQNPVTGEYSRLEPIRTGVTQVRTFVFYSLDIIGDRSNALVYSGMDADNMQVLAVYPPAAGKDGKLTFTAVADLRADGSISIQEQNRSDAYNLGLTNGESYTILTYTSDPDSPQTLNQIEHVFRWDRTVRRYEQASESKIEGKKIESRLVRQLQGGDIDSFEDFLTGLWYMPSSEGQETTKDVFFDAASDEIIFHNGVTEEVFVKVAGTPRRYGAYLTTRNRSIPSIQRMIDIELTGIDEIRLKVLEDVKLKIGVASNWDGVYRKKGSVPLSRTDTEQISDTLTRILDSSAKDWTAPDGQVFRTSGRTYSLVRSPDVENGQLAVLTVQGKPVVQLRPDQGEGKSRFLSR